MDSVLKLIGNTPMVKLSSVTEDVDADVLVKLEYLNPSGSLKDRIALTMIEQAEASGMLKPDSTIIEASTGNTGIALSFVGTLKGYRVIIHLPERVSEERVKIMERYGAEVQVMGEEEEQEREEKSISGGELEIPLRKKCLEEERRSPEIWWARQFSNPDNVLAHNQTGREILAQTRGNVDVFVASVGTGGTFLGVAEVLKERIPYMINVAVEPAASQFPMIAGYRKVPGASDEISGGIVAEILDRKMADEIVQITDEEAIEMAHRLVDEEGLFAGISSGANVLAAVQEARKLEKGQTVVTILPDSMDRYLSSEHYTT